MDFLRELEPVMKKRLGARSKHASLTYWNEANHIKESYRARTRLGVSGNEVRVPVRELTTFLSTSSDLLERIFSGRNKAKVVAKNGVPYTYFVNDVTDFEPTGEENHLGHPTVVPTTFSNAR